jgi:1-acyl-sn-glycerol-3-phosphate acyltransferase
LVLGEVRDRIDQLAIPFNHFGIDPYGVSKHDLRLFFSALALLYRRYFFVTHAGIEKVPVKGRAMIIGNHSGGVALDGAMTMTALLLEHEPPRLAQAMVEKFMVRMPFAGLWTNRCGQLTGLPEHARRLLEDDRLLMVFPEGARGTAKLYTERHNLVDFGTGFLRLALETNTPIIPFAFVGGGEAIPTVFNAVGIGKLFGAPYVPITPYLFPLPLPVRLHIQFGEAMRFSGNGTEEDDVIEGWVAEVKDRIRGLYETGRRAREQSSPKAAEATP